MLRAIAGIYIESQAVIGRDGYKIFRMCNYSSVTAYDKTVLSGEGEQSAVPPAAAAPPPPPQPPPPQPPPPPRARAWSAVAALALTASLGGIYYYRKMNDEDKEDQDSQMTDAAASAAAAEQEPPPVPALAAQLPAHAQFLLVGGGTAAFAAMRAIRSARPDAHVLLVAEERALPYMRPPLSKELWREPSLASLADADLDALAFRQWNGRRRNLAYEPEAFYTPPERMRNAPPGAALARGWRVVALDPAARTAELAAGHQRHTLTYDAALLATGVRARRMPALRAAAAAGRSVALRDVRDAARLARALDAPGVRRVAVVGGGYLAAELSAALAARLAAEGEGRRVVQLFREEAPLARVLPPYLATDVARRLAAAGVTLRARAEVAGCALEEERVRLRLADGGSELVDLVVECVGSEPRAELAARAGLELAADGGVAVNGELAARSGVWAAGDVASVWDAALGRRRVEHHDHAVVSGRLAGDNMAAAKPPQTYTHQSMFWSDLGPQLGYEAIGIIDSRLPTVGVFSADAVGADSEAPSEAEVGAPSAAPASREAAAAAAAGEAPARFERGVVFYLRERRVVGVLLWNLFNRMHVARQVLARGEFDDLLEAAKLFAPHEEE